MRFELALAVGIIFFCCWCAYIIIRMNSSLSPQQDSTANTSTNQITATSSSSSSSNLLEARQPGDQHHYFGARYRHQPQLYDQQLRTPLASAHYPAFSAVSPSQPPLNSGESFQTDYSSSRAFPPIDVAASAAAPDAGSKPSGPSGQEQGGGREGEDKEEEEADGDGEADGEGEEDEQPEDGGQVRRESEEIETGRSFSQKDADSTERDSQGNPIRAYRRHLINGKPVSDPSAVTLTRGDFDKVVNEIESDGQDDDGQGEEYDEQGEEHSSPAPRSQQHEGSESRLSHQLTRPTNGSRSRKKLTDADRAKRRSRRKPSEKMKGQKLPGFQLEEIDEYSKDNLLPAKVRDSHQHRLRESLQAQQWDDDATSAANPAGANSTTSDHSDPGQEEAEYRRQGAEQRSPSQEEEVQEESDITFKDLDSLSDGRFPFLEAGIEHQLEPEAGAQAEERVRVTRSIAAANNSGAGNGRWYSDSQHRAGEYDIGLSTNNEPPQWPANGNSSSQQTEVAAASGANKELSSQEDLAIEVLANPPPLAGANGLDNSSTTNYLLSNGHSGGPQQQTSAGAPSYGGSAYPVSGAPQVGQSDAANVGQVASQSQKIKKRKKKKKKENTHIKKAKKQHSKYQAAKAASMRRKSKLKGGGASEKKSKKGQKYAKSYKQFKGSTRGKKGARGMGNKGAKKGALYYKDQGYKKRGFKKNYQKVESGDHKTYFDEFRDKDHSKKWKDFKDKHHYSHGKQWAANDRKKFKNMSAKELKDKKYGAGKWNEREQSKYRRNYSKKANANSLEQGKKVKKRVKKKKQKSKHHHH